MPVRQTVQPVRRKRESRGGTEYANGGDRSLRLYQSCRQAAQVPTCNGDLVSEKDLDQGELQTENDPRNEPEVDWEG